MSDLTNAEIYTLSAFLQPSAPLILALEEIIAARETDLRDRIAAAVWAAPHLTTIEQPSGARAVRFYDRDLRAALTQETDHD